MAVTEMGRRLKVKGPGGITVTAFVDADGMIAMSNGLFGLRAAPEDLRAVLDALAPPPVAGVRVDDEPTDYDPDADKRPYTELTKGQQIARERASFKRQLDKVDAELQWEGTGHGRIEAIRLLAAARSSVCVDEGMRVAERDRQVARLRAEVAFLRDGRENGRLIDFFCGGMAEYHINGLLGALAEAKDTGDWHGETRLLLTDLLAAVSSPPEPETDDG